MKQFAISAAIISVLMNAANAAETLPAATVRFAKASDEVPSLRRHVLPLMARLGCNGRACHGSFQGRGGFRLSLFGYDFEADHAALTTGDNPRIDVDDPSDSLIVRKPLLAVDHGGGRRFDAGSWQHHLLLKWVQAGAKPVVDADPEFVSLTVEPREILFNNANATAQLKVIAEWSDGTREDVTPLCRFRSNDDSVATISDTGIVTAMGQGDTHVVAFYDNGVAPVSVLLPVSDSVGPKYPSIATPTKIDELVVAKLRKLGIVPSELCTDAEFLRRVSLDLTGTLPTAEEVVAFLADQSPDKRSRKIDELLARPTYAAWWTTRLCDITGNTEANGPLGGERGLNRDRSEQWYRWIYRRVQENTPYDELIAGIVLGVSRKSGQSFDEYCEETSAYFRKDNPADFSARETMPHFWARRSVGQPKDKALSFAYAFLGVRLECAECHKHPFDQWTKQDFDQFTVFFHNVKYTSGPGNSRQRSQEMRTALGLTGDQDSGDFARKFVALAREGKILPWQEVLVSGQKRPTNTKGNTNSKSPAGRVITPKLLGGEEVLEAQYDDPREVLMQWMRQPDNPYFARAFVNRVWANYFNVGIIEPPDDMNLANPPSNEPLLDYLVEGFIAHKFDMRWLHREIAGSRTYQSSWRPNATNEHDDRNFSRAVIRRLPAEVAYDAILHATASDDAQKALDEDITRRAIGLSSGYSGRTDSNYAVNLFGKPPRAINCDCERSNEPSLLQTIYLRNDDETLSLLDRTDGWLKQIKPELAKADAAIRDDMIRRAYLRVLNRPPVETELSRAREHVASSRDVVAGMRDLLWALLNTREFIVNH